MYSLFSERPRALGGQISPPRLYDVDKKIVQDVQTVVEYYRTASNAVRNDHLLVKLITAMNVPLSYELDHYFEVAAARALQVSNQFNLTSSIAAGKWHTGIFYRGCQERILVYTQYNRPKELVKNWWDLQPVQALEHPVSNLKYMLPNGQIHNTEQGLAVIGIDVPMLMLMYRCFMNWQHEQEMSGALQKLGMTHFVHKFVLPNMLYRQTDLAIFNRLVNLAEGRPMGDSLRRHPFYVSDYSERLDRTLQEVLDRIGKTRLTYPNILAQIPNIFRDHPLDMPDVTETMQVWWLLFYTRLKAIDFLWEVGGSEGRRMNQRYVNDLLIDLKRFKSENIFERHLDKDRLLDLKLLFQKYQKA